MVGVPPVACPMSVIFWPLSIVGESGVIAPAESVGLTITVSPDEHCETAKLAESVTL